jgi:hypothetical protein
MYQDSVKLGLLMEAAQTHQKLAEAAIERLNKQTQGLEAVVRDPIQRALIDGLRGGVSARQGQSGRGGHRSGNHRDVRG